MPYLSWVRSVTSLDGRKSWSSSNERDESKKPLHDDDDSVVLVRRTISNCLNEGGRVWQNEG